MLVLFARQFPERVVVQFAMRFLLLHIRHSMCNENTHKWTGLASMKKGVKFLLFYFKQIQLIIAFGTALAILLAYLAWSPCQKSFHPSTQLLEIMNMKKSILPVLALSAFLAGNVLTATPAEARPVDTQTTNCPGYAGYANLTPEQQTKLDALVKEHVAVVQPLSSQLDAKMLELDMLSPNPNTKPETISALVKEVTDLRTKLDQENNAFRDKLDKEGFPTMGYGMGHGGRGMMGSDYRSSDRSFHGGHRSNHVR